MTISQRDKRALLGLGGAAAVFLFLIYGLPDKRGAGSTSAPDSGGVALAQQRLIRLRQLAAVAPARDAIMKQVSNDLADRERGLIQADTAAQAQAAVLEVARRVGKSNQIDIRGGDFPTPKTTGDYGLVFATVSFECHIEQLVNFLADLSRQTELVVPNDERITAAQAKQKTVTVRMVLAGAVAKKLIPEKKGLGSF